MMRALLVLTVLAGLALPATASAAGYTLADDGASTPSLLVGPGDQSAVAVKYTSVCLLIGCNQGVTISSADDATPINNMSSLCNAITASSYNCTVGLGAHTKVTGTDGDDSVSGVCESSSNGSRNSPLDFAGKGGNDVVDNPTCAGSNVDMGPGDDRAVVNGTVNGGPGDDVLIPGPGAGPNTIIGGDGIDTASYANRAANQPTSITLDGARNDGEQGQDLVAGDVENATGGAGNDSIVGNNGPNVLVGGPGNDTIDGRGGLDFIDAGPGNDTVFARDGAPDRVTCGDGNDSAVVDAFDSVDGCEHVDSSRALMPDVDGDGVTAPLDCNDLDPGIRPGLFDKPGDGIDQDCTGSDAPFAHILTSLQTTFLSGRTTRFPEVKLRGVPEHATVTLRCLGGRKKGCFSGTVSFSFPRGKDTANIGRSVRHRRFKPGSTFQIAIAAPDSIAKVIRLQIRRSKAPKQRVLCQPPGARRPGRC